MFETLSERLTQAAKNLSGKGRLSEANIKVINGIAGTVDEVVEAFISDRLDDRVFHLPGFPLKPSTGKGNERR